MSSDDIVKGRDNDSLNTGSKIHNVIVLGASGTLGRPTLKRLSQAGFKVTIVTRPDSDSDFLPEYKVIRASYTDKAALAKALVNQDALLFLLGHVPQDIEPLVVDVAAEAGVKRFILGEFGFDSENEAALAINPVIGKKQSVYKHAQAKVSTGMSWTGIVTGPFFDLSVKTGFFDIHANERTATLYDAGENEAKVNTTTIDCITKAIVAVLRRPEETANRHVYISSFALTGTQIVEAHEEVLGGSKFTIGNASTIELEKQGKLKLARGDMGAIVDLLKAGIWRKGGGCDYGSYKTLDNELLELPIEDLHTTIASALNLPEKRSG